MTRVVLTLLLVAAKSALAGGAVGMIANLKGEVKWPGHVKPDIMDEIHSGDTLNVGAGASVVLIYFSDCRKETITGATEVKVGAAASEVKDKNALVAEHTKCEPPGIAATAKVGSVPGALVLMGANKGVDAEKSYLAAVEKDPKDISARLGYAIFLENRGHFEKALAQVVAVSPSLVDSAALAAERGSLRAATALQSLAAWSRAHPSEKHDATALDAAGVADLRLIKVVNEKRNPVEAFSAAYHANPKTLARFYKQITDSK